MPNTKLAPPGAGLPRPEAFLIRRFVFPFLRLKLNKAKSIALFHRSGKAILPLIEEMDLASFTEPVLIDRLAGLEDSSRNWSVELTLEHIQVVSAAALFILSLIHI